MAIAVSRSLWVSNFILNKNFRRLSLWILFRRNSGTERKGELRVCCRAMNGSLEASGWSMKFDTNCRIAKVII